MVIQIHGFMMNYHDVGTGEAVVLVHAFPMSKEMWDEQVAGLSPRFRVIAMDLRGFGGSDTPEGPYGMARHADDIKALMDSLSIPAATLVGLSMGGYISLAFYRRYPEMVRGLVLADTRATADTPEAKARRLESAKKAEREGAGAIADDMVSLALAESTRTRRPDIVSRFREIITANSPAGIAAAQRGMAEREDSTDLLPKIFPPVLLLVGSEDRLTPVSEMQTMLEHLPDARLQEIAGAGHCSNLEQPEAFNRALIEFLDSLNRAPES